MVKQFQKIGSLLVGFVMVCVFAQPANAQLESMGKFLYGGADDAQKLARAYLEPLPSGLGADINSGWLNSSRPHKILGFSLQIRGSLAFIPTEDQTFDINDLNLQKITPDNPANTISPTLGGDADPGPGVHVEENGVTVPNSDFNLPEGTGFSYVPAPMVQAGIGLIKGTDVTIRYIPNLNFDPVTFGMKGVGVRHSINSWLPAGNILPVDITVMAGFTNINLDVDIDEKPKPSWNPDPTYTGSYDNQKVDASINTFTIKATVGKTLPFLSAYGGLQYGSSTLSIDMLGDYPVPITVGGQTQTQTITDPFTYEEDGKNKFGALVGARFKLAIFSIYAEYTLAKYSVLNAGIGFGIR